MGENMEKVAGGTPTPRDVWWGNAVVPDCTGEKKTVAFRWIVANGMGCKEVFVRIELLEEV